MTPPDNSIREKLMGLFQTAVAAAHPGRALPPHLPPPPAGRLVLLAAGKAGAAMARAAVPHYLEGGLPPERLTGFATTRYGYGLDTSPLELIEAGHPLPDANSVDAARRALAMAAAAGPDDLVLVLLSGGGSALWAAPIRPLTLADKQALTKALLRSGATISEINCVRKHLSAIKGGRLAMAAGDAPLITLAISDVPGDEPSAIASGPTVADPTTQADALAICARYGVTLPGDARAILADPANESLKPGTGGQGERRFQLVARPADALEAAAAKARAAGLEPVVLGDALEGEARELGKAHAELALEAARAGRRCVLLSGGEATVTLTGSGRGGPNQEYALALGINLRGDPRIAAIACDTDGTDGGEGSSDDPAGALVLCDMLARAEGVGLDAEAMLDNNDSTGFFTALGDLVTCGPTYTNVNDFRAIMVNAG